MTSREKCLAVRGDVCDSAFHEIGQCHNPARKFTPMILPIILFLGCTEPHGSMVNSDELNGLISLSLNNDGDFAKGYPWKLTMDEDRTASLTIYSVPNAIRSFKVTEPQIEELRTLLIAERFFELGDDYGQQVPSGSTKTITIRCGSHAQTVKLRFLMNWVHSGETSKLRDPARAVRVWRFIRQWFTDADAVDLARYDEMVLKASQRS